MRLLYCMVECGSFVKFVRRDLMKSYARVLGRKDERDRAGLDF